MIEISGEDFRYLYECKMAYAILRYLKCDKSKQATIREQLNIFYSNEEIEDIDVEIRNQALRNVIDELES